MAAAPGGAHGAVADSDEDRDGDAGLRVPAGRPPVQAWRPCVGNKCATSVTAQTRME
jgi:hypothetical protein